MLAILPLFHRQLGPQASRHVRSKQIERVAGTGGSTLLGTIALLLLVSCCLLHPTPIPRPNHGGGGVE